MAFSHVAWHNVVALSALLVGQLVSVAGDAAVCTDSATCSSRLGDLRQGLKSNSYTLGRRQLTLDALGSFRNGVLGDTRAPVPTALREHLRPALPELDLVSVDARHAPTSQDTEKYMKRRRTILPDKMIQFFGFCTATKNLQLSVYKGYLPPTAVLVSVDTAGILYITNFEGETVLHEPLDLGHEGRKIVHFSLYNNFVVTSDEQQNIRIHEFTFTGDVVKVNKTEAPADTEARDKGKKPSSNKYVEVHAKAKFVCTGTIPPHTDKWATNATGFVTALSGTDRGGKTGFVVTDSIGTVSSLNRKCEVQARQRISEEEGGVTGMVKASGTHVFVFTNRTWAFFDASKFEVRHPPCAGWVSATQDASGDSTRAVISLLDGDILVFDTKRLSTFRACEVAAKGPRISKQPLQVKVTGTSLLALQVDPLSPTTGHSATSLSGLAKRREFFIVDLLKVEKGYFAAPPQAVVLQVAFGDRLPEAFAHHYVGAPKNAMERYRTETTQLGLRFRGVPGIEMYDFNAER
eukprot:TRINITY_DN112568_c0_g1_i1.p1 TRINITY_DN112568_c0_g1~~TRINITY_DN112568_c0_g1_i1.p1  ORF type:complete len:520 (+),score=109.28 TRINITY_DN112568_c0_g1_i1:73-1632(+)